MPLTGPMTDCILRSCEVLPREAESKVGLEKASLAAAARTNPTHSRIRTREGSHAEGATSGTTPNSF